MSNDIGEFALLVDRILIELKLENLKLYFKLMNHKLTDVQHEYIDKELPLVIERQLLKNTLKEELRIEYDKQTEKLITKNEIALTTLQDIIIDLEKQLKIKNSEIFEKENYINTLIEQLRNDKKAVSEQILSLKKTIESLKEEINDSTDIISRKDNLIDEQTKINKSLNAKLDMQYDKFSKFAYEEWKRSNIKLLQENEFLEKDCEELLKQVAELNGDIKALEERIEHWDELVNKYVQNIDENIIKNALNTSLLEYTSLSSNKIACTSETINSIYTKESIKGTKISVCSNINEFAENIAENIEAVGAGKLADEMANYIIGIFTSGLIPLIIGYKAREIATAISTAYCGETPYTITLPNGYTNSKELIKLYHQDDSKLVLVEDAIGTMNENSLLPLLREKAQQNFSQKMLSGILKQD